MTTLLSLLWSDKVDDDDNGDDYNGDDTQVQCDLMATLATKEQTI